MVPLVLLMKRPPKGITAPSTKHARFTSGDKQMRILSNSFVALAGVLALASCIPAANGQIFPAGVTPVRGAVTAVPANSVTVQTPQGPVFVQLVQSVKVFARMPSDLGHITNKTFVGVTSTKG